MPARAERRVVSVSDLNKWARTLSGAATMIQTFTGILSSVRICSIEADCDRAWKRIDDDIKRLTKAVSGGFGEAIAASPACLQGSVGLPEMLRILGTDSGTDSPTEVPTNKDLRKKIGKKKQRGEGSEVVLQ